MGAKVVLFIESIKLFDGKLFFERRFCVVAGTEVLGYDGCYTPGAHGYLDTGAHPLTSIASFPSSLYDTSAGCPLY